MLQNSFNFENVKMLDLFGGTGSISYEFASRGTSVIHLVEQDPRNIRFIRSTLAEMKLDGIRALHIDARAFMRTCTFKYDIVFADPPYELSWLKDIPDLVINAGILTETGIFILEHPKGYSFNSHPNFFEHRFYGSVNFSFFR